MITVRECQFDEVEKFRKLEGDFHYMGKSHGACDTIRLIFEEVGKTMGFSRHARDFFIPNDRPKVLFMKPFVRDAWDLIVSNDLPRAYEKAAHSKADGLLPFRPKQIDSLYEKLRQVVDSRARNRKIHIGFLLTAYTMGMAAVSADALSCHPETAQTILAQGGDYVLQLKGDTRIVKRNADAICRPRDPVSRFVKKTSGTGIGSKAG